MCAINCVIWEDETLVRAMNVATRHRGPDGTAVQVLSGATFGHNRLAIIDPDPRSAQPMCTPDGRYTIVFNGEVYNFRELKKELQYSWRTESDTEVILAGFEKWGTDVFTRLNGMYALAIHDKRTSEVVIARDPFGIKPLYITKTLKGYAFSSEIKGILEVGVSRTLDSDAFGAYMRTLYVPAPRTLFSGIEKFPPGHVGTIRNNSLTLKPFEYQADSALIKSYDTNEIRTAVMAAVNRQMVSDRPLGVYLSGGIDSSSILAAATQAGGSMDTYSIGFELATVEEPERFNADSVLARRIAKHFGARHHEFFIAPNEALSLLEKAVYQLDEPIGNATIAAQVALSEKARESVVVALTGDGGDEVFGGYPRYLLSRRMSAYQHMVPRALSKLVPSSRVRKMETESIADRFALFHFQKDSELSQVLYDLPPYPNIVGKHMRNLMEADRATWLVDEALLRSDKLAMANGVETRPPFLDLELVHQVSAIPFERHVSLFDTKTLLKQAFKNDLPAWVLNQPKRGWFSPGGYWLSNAQLANQIDEIISPDYAPATSALFNWDGIRMTLQARRENRGYHVPLLISILMFQLWSRQYDVSL